MVKYICPNCFEESDEPLTACSHCGNLTIAFIDEAGGYHEGGTGTMPDGTECGECGERSCANCEVWHFRQNQRGRYGIHWCEECGNELEIWLDTIESVTSGEFEGFPNEHHHLMWHCTECGCDYESYWDTRSGGTDLERKFWG